MNDTSNGIDTESLTPVSSSTVYTLFSELEDENISSLEYDSTNGKEYPIILSPLESKHKHKNLSTDQQNLKDSSNATIIKRKVGRPKGSKNKKKILNEEGKRLFSSKRRKLSISPSSPQSSPSPSTTFSSSSPPPKSSSSSPSSKEKQIEKRGKGRKKLNKQEMETRTHSIAKKGKDKESLSLPLSVNFNTLRLNDIIGQNSPFSSSNPHLISSISQSSSVNVNIVNDDIINAFHRACRYGQLNTVENMLQGKKKYPMINVNIRDENGNTALHEAAIYGQTEMVKLLLKSGADPGIRNLVGELAIDLVKGRIKCQPSADVLKIWMERHESSREIPIFEAIWNNDFKEFERILSAISLLAPSPAPPSPSPLHSIQNEKHPTMSSDNDIRGRLGQTILHDAALLNRYQMVEYLLKRQNFNPNVEISIERKEIKESTIFKSRKLESERELEMERGNSTPLHDASHFSSFESIKLLLESGADFDKLDSHGKKAMDYANKLTRRVFRKYARVHGLLDSSILKENYLSPIYEDEDDNENETDTKDDLKGDREKSKEKLERETIDRKLSKIKKEKREKLDSDNDESQKLKLSREERKMQQMMAIFNKNSSPNKMGLGSSGERFLPYITNDPSNETLLEGKQDILINNETENDNKGHNDKRKTKRNKDKKKEIFELSLMSKDDRNDPVYKKYDYSLTKKKKREKLQIQEKEKEKELPSKRGRKRGPKKMEKGKLKQIKGTRMKMKMKLGKIEKKETRATRIKNHKYENEQDRNNDNEGINHDNHDSFNHLSNTNSIMSLPVNLSLNSSSSHSSTIFGKLDLNFRDKSTGRSLLHKYSGSGNLEKCRELLNLNGKLIHSKDNGGYTALHVASLKGRLDIVKLLLESGADPNASAFNGDRPLHDAMENGHLEIVSILLDFGADPSIENDQGYTPYSLLKDNENDYESGRGRGRGNGIIDKKLEKLIKIKLERKEKEREKEKEKSALSPTRDYNQSSVNVVASTPTFSASSLISGNISSSLSSFSLPLENGKVIIKKKRGRPPKIRNKTLEKLNDSKEEEGGELMTIMESKVMPLTLDIDSFLQEPLLLVNYGSETMGWSFLSIQIVPLYEKKMNLASSSISSISSSLSLVKMASLSPLNSPYKSLFNIKMNFDQIQLLIEALEKSQKATFLKRYLQQYQNYSNSNSNMNDFIYLLDKNSVYNIFSESNIDFGGKNVIYLDLQNKRPSSTSLTNDDGIERENLETVEKEKEKDLNKGPPKLKMKWQRKTANISSVTIPNSIDL